MNDFIFVQLGGLAAITWLLVRVLGPFASALAKRIEGHPRSTSSEDPAVPLLRAELEELQERVDFLERALASQQPPRAVLDAGRAADSPKLQKPI